MVKIRRLLLTGMAVVSVLAVPWIVATRTASHRTQQVQILGSGQVVHGELSGSEATPVASDPAGPFYIVGSVDGLFPGANRPLTLLIINPYPRSITVVSLTTTVGSVSRRCPAANLSVSPFSGQLFVAAHRTATLTVRATMPHSTGDACQGAVFLLAYQATATVS